MNKPVYPISKAGSCARTLCADRLGLLETTGGPVPEYLRIAAREGMRHEKFIQTDILEFGWESIAKKAPVHCGACDREGYHVEIDRPKYKLIGHVDDFNWQVNKPTIIHVGEYKALGRFNTDKLVKHGLGIYRAYETQISLYSYAKGNMPIFYVIKNRDTGKMNISTYPEGPIIDMDMVFKRLDEIEDWVATGDLIPCDVEDGMMDKYSCTNLCNNDDPQATDFIVPENITRAVLDLRKSKELESEAGVLKTESRGIIQAFMGAHGKTRLTYDEMLISVIPEGKVKKYDVPDEVKKEYVTISIRPAYIRTRDNKEKE